MCGLAGLITDLAISPSQLRAHAKEMASTLEHRGPDDKGIYADADAGIALGFRRLAILDPSEAGHQPMTSASGRYTVVFNGEIYNFRDLRRRLSSRDQEFRSDSDTEVMLAAFDRWGVQDSLSHFVGMFSFAVWDRHARTLTLARDRLGIKPLFVWCGGDTVAFASELKSLCRAPGFPRRLNRKALADYLRYLYVPAPNTIYQDTFKLKPGHTLTIRSPDLNELPDPRPFWSLQEVARRGIQERFRGSPESAAERLHELIEDSVQLRMIADVPVGALFSGGIDSTSIVAAMQEASKQPVKTFTVRFDQGKHDESEAARSVAEYLGTDHTELMVGGQEALNLVPRLPQMFDEPHANPSQIPTFMVCNLARKHITVGLAGDGGDELFGGYNRYLYGKPVLRWADAVPGSVRKVLAGTLGALSASEWDAVYRSVSNILPGNPRYRLAGKKIRKLGGVLAAEDQGTMYRSLLSACDKPEEILVDESARGELERTLSFQDGNADLLELMLLTDQTSYLPDDLLAKLDRASMATSLEMRVPLLDHRIIEFSWRLPPEMKIRDGVTKWVLREQLKGRVPQRLWDRPKVGFTVPLTRWLKGPLKEWADDLLSPRKIKKDGIFQANRVTEMWKGVREGETQLSEGLWAILMFQAWKEQWSPGTGL